jgi:hypothetical protein
MQWNTISKERKSYDIATQLGNWHPVFAWVPIPVRKSPGITRLAMWCKVMRKYKIGIDLRDSFVFVKVEYMLPSDLTLAILEGTSEGSFGTVDAMYFTSYESQKIYREMAWKFTDEADRRILIF